MIQKPQSHDPTKEIFKTSLKYNSMFFKVCYQTHLSLAKKWIKYFSEKDQIFINMEEY